MKMCIVKNVVIGCLKIMIYVVWCLDSLWFLLIKLILFYINVSWFYIKKKYF